MKNYFQALLEHEGEILIFGDMDKVFFLQTWDNLLYLKVTVVCSLKMF